MSTGVAATTARQDGPGKGDVSPVGGEVGIFQYCYNKYLSMQYDYSESSYIRAFGLFFSPNINTADF